MEDIITMFQEPLLMSNWNISGVFGVPLNNRNISGVSITVAGDESPAGET